MPTALAIDAWLGVDVTFLILPKDAEARAEWRAIRDARDDVAEIYGRPVPGKARRVILPAGDADPRVIVPREAPERRLLLSTGTDVWDAEQVRWLGVGISTLAGLLALLLWRRRPRVAAEIHDRAVTPDQRLS